MPYNAIKTIAIVLIVSFMALKPAMSQQLQGMNAEQPSDPCLVKEIKPPYQCMTPAQEKRLRERTAVRKAQIINTEAFRQLVERERAIRGSQTHTYFAWPLRAAPAYAHIPHYYTIPFFVDHGSGTSLEDYQCNERTYDGHRGTDINVWPFFWHMMDQEYVHVVAGAPGIVMETEDENYNDMNCSCPSGEPNNFVSVIHADSSISYYMHIKDNSIVVEDEDVVDEGQMLALVGSSGCSYNPHLHFEVRDPSGNTIDPFAGSCNDLNGNDTWWQDQKPYWEPRINRMMTHSTEPELHGYDGNWEWCASGESINKQNQFSPGATIWFGCGIYSPQPNDEIDFRIYEPDGSQIWQQTYTYGGSDPAVADYYAFSRLLAGNAPSGTYRFRANYDGLITNHWFTVGCTSSYTLSGALPFHHGYIASSSITNSGQTSQTDGNTAYYQSAGHVLLTPGFAAYGGTSLHARIRSCGYTE